MFTFSSHCGNQSGSSCTGTDNQNLFAFVVQVLWPRLRMHNAALVILHAGPFGGVALGVLVIALTHPQEIGGHLERVTFSKVCNGDSPALFKTVP